MVLKINKIRAVTVLFVVSAAAASGYFMQNSNTLTVQNATAKPQELVIIPVEETSLAEDSGPAVHMPPKIDQVTRAQSQPVLFVSDPAAILPEANTIPETPAVAECEAGFTAMAAPGAMVDLTLEAPCYAGQVVDIFHAGMRFSSRLDQSGLMQASVPALEEDAFFNAMFTDGHIESTNILMLTASDYQRVALFWQGETGFTLYALENNALYGSAGHVSVTSPFSPAYSIAEARGFLTKLGQIEQGYSAIIYSYPAMLTDSGAGPEISIQAEVLAGTCDSKIMATILRSNGMSTLEALPLTMAVPGCDAVGEYLVLKNLPQSLRIAAR